MPKHMSNKVRLREIVAKEVSSINDYEQFCEDVIDAELVAETKGGFDLVRDGTGDGSGNGLWVADRQSYVDARTLKGLFYSEDWVYIVVDLIASKISSQQLKVMVGAVVDGNWVTRPAEGHPLQNLIDMPNQHQDYYAWMYSLVVDFCLLGNSIQWQPNTLDSIIGLPAECVELDFDAQGNIRRYMAYEYGQEQGITNKSKFVSFDPREIIHIRRPNPSSMLWGLSPFIPGRNSVLFNRYSTEYLNNFYIKGATPGIALEMSDEANEKVALRLLRSFEMTYTGRRNQRRTMVLPKGVKATPLTQTIADQKLVDIINMNRETILALLKVPKHEVGLQTAGSLGSDEYTTALKNFWEATLKPGCRIIQGALTRFFGKQLGPNIFLEFDLADVKVLHEDEFEKADLAEKMLKTHTVNEVRKELYDKLPLPGGDITPVVTNSNAFGNGGLLPQPPQQPAKPQEPPKAGQVPLASLLAGPDHNVGGVPLDANPAPDSTMSVTVEDTKEADSMVRQKARVATFKKSNEDWFNGREQRIASVYDKASNEIYKTTVEIFSDMAGSLVRTTQKYLKTKHYKPQATKATEVGNPKPKAEVLNRTELKRKLRDAVNQYEERWIGDNVKVLENSVDVGYDVTLSFPFNHTNQQQLDAMREQGVEGRRAILEERSLNTFAHMNRTTTDQILDTIDAGVASNKTVDQISDDIRAKFADEGMTAGRAQTIARTETLTAVSLGQAAAMADAATVIPNLKKMWLTADDDRVRPEHVAVDGEVKSWDAEFTNNLQFPRDPSGPADQVINCRCTFVALPADQIDDVSGDNLSSNEAS